MSMNFETQEPQALLFEVDDQLLDLGEAKESKSLTGTWFIDLTDDHLALVLRPQPKGRSGRGLVGVSIYDVQDRMDKLNDKVSSLTERQNDILEGEPDEYEIATFHLLSKSISGYQLELLRLHRSAKLEIDARKAVSILSDRNAIQDELERLTAEMKDVSVVLS